MVKKLLFYAALWSSSSLLGQTFTMSNVLLNTCSGTHLDPGGTGNYADNASVTQTICSTLGNCVSLTFTSFDLENGFDYLEIHDGATATSPQLPGSPFTGSTSPGTVTCSSGCITLVFTSDISISLAGWSASINCGACPPPPPPPDLTFGWTQRASNPGPGRHRSTAISIGSRGYAGLGHITTSPEVVYDDWWEYDPGTNTWMQKANYAGGTVLHACGFTIGNYGYVGTGRDEFGASPNDFYKYDPTTNTWTPIASVPTTGLRGCVAFEIGGKGYIATGAYTNQVWEYNPTTNVWTAKAPFPGGVRSSAAGFSIGSKGYVGTGDNGSLFGDFYEYDPATNVWTAKAAYGGVMRTEAGGFALNGKGYIGTGLDYSTGNLEDFWAYTPATNTWLQVTDFGGSGRRYLSCFTIGARAYGCFGTSGTNYNDLWEYGNLAPVSGINNQTLEGSIKTFPNPFIDEITFSISTDVIFQNNATIKIMDVNGKIVRTYSNISEHLFKMERGDLANGIYFYEFQNNNARTTGKFIAQ
jgi:N-acetylneuraminic acid mutarotase